MMKPKTKYRLQILSGTGIAAAVVVGIVLLIGEISQFQALELLGQIKPTIRFFASSIMTASATILALMATMLSLGASSDYELKPDYYRRIKHICLYVTISFCGAMLLLMLVLLPTREAESLPVSWYRYLYYAIMALAAALGALTLAIVMMLYTETRNMIIMFGFDRSSPIRKEEEEEE